MFHALASALSAVCVQCPNMAIFFLNRHLISRLPGMFRYCPSNFEMVPFATLLLLVSLLLLRSTCAVFSFVRYL